MPVPLFRYPLDSTGTDPNNRVVGEQISLSAQINRAAVPKYGPIYAESLVIRDDVTNAVLVRDVDFKLLELVQSATAKFGKEIVAAILITNPSVNSTIRINYQVLGGLYQFNDEAIVNLYETYLNDDRPIDWSEILNKPQEFPPALHNHLLEDIYGFEPVIVSLERIRNAIAVSDLPAYQYLVDWVLSRVEYSTAEDIHLGTSNARLVTNQRLIQSMSEFNFNSITLDPLITTANVGDVLSFNLRSTNLPNSTTLYWTIEHDGTLPADFVTTGGIVNVNNNRGTFLVQLTSNVAKENPSRFRIALHKNATDGFVLLRSPNIVLSGTNPLADAEIPLVCCLFNPVVDIAPETYYLIKEY